MSTSELEEAFARFDKATRLAPQNMQFLTAREVVKAQLVFDSRPARKSAAVGKRAGPGRCGISGGP